MRMVLASVVLLLLAGPATAQIVDDTKQQEALREYRAGLEFMSAEQFERAEPHFREAIRLNPLLTLAHYELGRTYMALQRYASAIQAYVGCRDAYERIAGLEQTEAVGVDRMREREIQELRDSISILKSGRVTSAGNSSVDHTITQIESRISQLEMQRQRDVTGDVKVPAEVVMALGSAYLRNGSVEDAEREYLAAVELNDRFGEAHNNLAVIYMMTRRYEQALASARKAERNGFHVNPRMLADIEAALKQ